MLEQPFGVEAADISLLSIGADLSDDLDGILRSAQTVARRAAVPPKRDAVTPLGGHIRVEEEDDGDDGGDDDGGDDDGDGGGEGGDDAGGDEGGDGATN